MSVSFPVIQGGIKHSQFNDGINKFVTQIDFARIQAAARNRAYLVMVKNGDAGTRGEIHITEGVNSSCTFDNFVDDDTGDDAIIDIRVVDFTAKHPRVKIKSQLPETLSENGLCIKPDGRILEVSVGGGQVIAGPEHYGVGEAVFTLELVTANGVSSGMERRVVVPYNGVPKVESE